MASHLLEAYRLAPDAADADDLRAKAQEALVRAGERAASLGASAEAQRYFEQGAELAADPVEQAPALSAPARWRSPRARTSTRWRCSSEPSRSTRTPVRHTEAARASSWLALAEQRMGRNEAA